MNHNFDYEKRVMGKILVVEDSPTQAKFLEMILIEQGYRVSSVTSGLEAIDLMTSQRHDLVISDILMPGIDGFELCRRIRETDRFANIPVILLTLLDNPADVLLGLEAGADYFISKPYSKEFLLSRVQRSLSVTRQQKTEGVEEKVEVHQYGKTYSLSASMPRIIDLFLATYETAVEKNRELQSAQKALRELNQELERRVVERTAELRDKDQLLMQQSRQAAMGEMIGNIAHQWRQPLNSLGLIIQSFPMVKEIGELSQEFLDSSSKSAMEIINHMSQTIDDFRNYFRPDKEKTLFSLSGAVAKTVSLIKESFASQRISLEVETADEMVVNGYPNEYAQVLFNILLNARDVFAGQNIDDPAVNIVIGRENGRAVVTISDNGGGIPENIIGRIFDPYFTTKGPDKGTGVGLYMSKAIIEKNMGGRLTARNVGGGAEFRIEV